VLARWTKDVPADFPLEPMVPDLIAFEEALERTEKTENRVLLVGNGFSAQYFSYKDLLEKSGLADDSSVRRLFDILDTFDFEAVVRALEAAVSVAKAYGHDTHADELEADAQMVREALVNAVKSTHPEHREDLGVKYASSAAFLAHFSTVFTLNYDLLLYWVNLENLFLKDGFGLGERKGKLHGPFDTKARCSLYNLHGGLHLFDNGAGEIMKATNDGSGVLATITDIIISKRRFPVYVAEGTSQQKMRKINSVGYLRHCYDNLRENSKAVFVYGHSAAENDAHIYRAIFKSKASHLYFGVYKPNKEKLEQMDGRLASYQKTVGSSVEYTFFDSRGAKVWEA
jgi:hypothetical protein